MSILDCPDAVAQTGAIEQNFATSLTVVATAGHYAFISERRPIKIIKN
ncbi:hypothetical protein J6524_32870 [Bradyrhizobium sp. WSM 1738]|nr:hypothetical protein [Bradyrhizobium hereditatis]MCA6119630.1 hypothetical protein [Bradyrhizobium hereditatis]